MNQRKLHLEIMRAILRSSTLAYDEAYPIVANIAPQISSAVQKREFEIAVLKEELRKKNEFQKIGTRSVSNQ